MLSVIFLNTGLFIPKTFCSQDQKSTHGTKGPRSKSSMNLSFLGTSAHWNVHSHGLLAPWNVCSQKSKVPRNFRCMGGRSYWAVAWPLFGPSGPQMCLACPLLRTFVVVWKPFKNILLYYLTTVYWYSNVSTFRCLWIQVHIFSIHMRFQSVSQFVCLTDWYVETLYNHTFSPP